MNGIKQGPRGQLYCPAYCCKLADKAAADKLAAEHASADQAAADKVAAKKAAVATAIEEHAAAVKAAAKKAAADKAQEGPPQGNKQGNIIALQGPTSYLFINVHIF